MNARSPEKLAAMLGVGALVGVSAITTEVKPIDGSNIQTKDDTSDGYTQMLGVKDPLRESSLPQALATPRVLPTLTPVSRPRVLPTLAPRQPVQQAPVIQEAPARQNPPEPAANPGPENEERPQNAESGGHGSVNPVENSVIPIEPPTEVASETFNQTLVFFSHSATAGLGLAVGLGAGYLLGKRRSPAPKVERVVSTSFKDDRAS